METPANNGKTVKQHKIGWNWILTGWAFILAATAIAYWLGQSSGFSDADIAAAKASIRTEFEKRDGVTVSEVALIRENPRKLIGYVKFKIDVLNLDVTKSCSATIGEGNKYIMRCE